MLASLKTELAKIQNRINVLLDLLLDKEITKTEYDQKLENLKNKQDELNTRMLGYEQTDESYYISVSKLLGIARQAYEIFENSEPTEKRQLLNLVVQNCRLREKTLLFELRKPFDSLMNFNKS